MRYRSSSTSGGHVEGAADDEVGGRARLAGIRQAHGSTTMLVWSGRRNVEDARCASDRQEEDGDGREDDDEAGGDPEQTEIVQFHAMKMPLLRSCPCV